MSQTKTPNEMIEDIKQLYGLRETSRCDCGIYEKIYFVDTRYNTWIQKKYYCDESKNTLMEI